MTVSEGDDNEEGQIHLCISLVNRPDRPYSIQRKLHFLLTTVTGSAGEL